MNYEDSNGLVMAQKLEAIGGKGGKQWDDGADYDYVTKVYIRGGREGIHYIKFDYVKDGQAIDGSIHGVLGDGFTHTVCFRFSCGYIRGKSYFKRKLPYN